MMSSDRLLRGMFVLPIIVMLCMAAPVQAGTEVLDEDIDSLVKRGGKLAVGNQETAGDWVIASVKIRDSWGDDAIPQARQAARTQVAEFFGAQVSGTKEASRESQSEKVDGKTTTKFKKSFKQVSKTEVDQYLRGLGLDRVVTKGDDQYAIFVLSELGMEQSANLAEAVRKIGHEAGEDGTTTVTSVGMVVIRDDDVPAARAAAVAQAQREALEKVMGMVVVGVTQANRESGGHQQFRESVFSNTDGFIEDWEVLGDNDGQVGDHYRIVINAIVTPQKLYEDYRTHLQSMGDPTFEVKGDDEKVCRRFQRFFKEKGFRIVERDADWIIEVDSEYREREDPRNPSVTMTLLDMGFKMRNRATGDVIGPLKGPRRFNSRLQDPVAARSQLLDKGFSKWKDTLHETINDEIVRMAREGRPVTVTLSEWPGDTATAGRLESSVQSLPGVNSINRRLDSGTLVFELKYVGDAAFLQEMLQETMRSILSHEQMDLLQLESQGNDSVAFAFVQ